MTYSFWYQILLNLADLADDNTICTAENVNSDKFKAIILKRDSKMKDYYHLNINQEVIKSGNCVKLLGVEVDTKLSFENHISALDKKQVISNH